MTAYLDPATTEMLLRHPAGGLVAVIKLNDDTFNLEYMGSRIATIRQTNDGYTATVGSSCVTFKRLQKAARAIVAAIRT